MNKKAVCLFSGGLDSTTCVYYAQSVGYEVYCLSVDYGQRHKKEVAAAEKIAQKLGVEHRVVTLEFPWGGNALTDTSIAVPTQKTVSTIGDVIPATYVPSRNIIFLSLAFSWAEAIGAHAVVIGVNQLDYSGYPDCREEFIQAFYEAIRVGTKMGVEHAPIEIVTPLIRKSKKEIVALAHSLGVPIDETWSCYVGDEEPCGECESCVLRQEGIRSAQQGVGKNDNKA